MLQRNKKLVFEKKFLNNYVEIPDLFHMLKSGDNLKSLAHITEIILSEIFF